MFRTESSVSYLTRLIRSSAKTIWINYERTHSYLPLLRLHRQSQSQNREDRAQMPQMPERFLHLGVKGSQVARYPGVSWLIILKTGVSHLLAGFREKRFLDRLGDSKEADSADLSGEVC